MEYKTFFVYYFCLLFLSLNPIKIDKIPIGINNNITQEYLIIPATPNIFDSPIILTSENESIGEIKVVQNNILPKVLFLSIFLSLSIKLVVSLEQD